MKTVKEVTKKYGISYLSSIFEEWFGDMKFKSGKKLEYSMVLGKSMSNKETLETLKPSEVTIGEVFATLKDMSHDDCGLFYVRDADSVLHTVGVHWFGGGWSVDAHSVEYPYDWDAGFQVFSRNPFGNKTSDPLSLENAIKICKEHGLTVTKTY